MGETRIFSKILIIQTAFIGDVILATGLIEKLHTFYPEARIDFLLRKGNEELLLNHPYISETLIWDKKSRKTVNLLDIFRKVRGNRYDLIVNCQRFLSSGLITVFGSGGAFTTGFNKNPLSGLFSQSFSHDIDPNRGTHEIERNHLLIKDLTDDQAATPRLYPSTENYKRIEKYTESDYVCLAPASVWFTKQMPKSKWIELANKIPEEMKIFLIGSPSDKNLCDNILESLDREAINLAGELSLMESAALIDKSQRVYVNDSAPLHFGSALNTPTTAFFCSTVPEFGFGPLAENSVVKEVSKDYLSCRPCGLHGKKNCPESHFKCGNDIKLD